MKRCFLRLLVSAGDGACGNTERSSIAAELRVRRDHLLALANTRDADGRYVFSGYQDSVQPLAKTGAGYVYGGDSGRRAVQVADSAASCRARIGCPRSAGKTSARP